MQRSLYLRTNQILNIISTSLEFDTLSGALAVISSIAVWFGTLDQIALNRSRGTLIGATFAETSMRVWGKLPWVLYAVTRPNVDYWVLSANLIGISLAYLNVLQFLILPPHRDSWSTLAGVVCLSLLGLATLMVASFWPAILRYEYLMVDELPVYVTIFALIYGNFVQFCENRRIGSTGAISQRRYGAFVFTNATWLLYALCSEVGGGWNGNRALIYTSVIGLITNSLVCFQSKSGPIFVPVRSRASSFAN